MSVKAEIDSWAGEWFTGRSLPHVSVRVFLATCMIGDRRSKESRRASESDGRGQHDITKFPNVLFGIIDSAGIWIRLLV